MPKVIVMGSSTTSETTINTSTDSANTIVTTMTATDGEATEDSLEMHEPVDYLTSDNLDGHKILQPVPVTPKTPATAKPQTPPTALGSSGSKDAAKFTFDLPIEEHNKLLKDLSTPKAVPLEQKFTFDTAKDKKDEESKVNGSKEVKTVEKLMEEQVEALKMEARRRNSYKAAQTMDFDKIEVVESRSPKEQRRSFRRKVEQDKRHSPKRRAERRLSSSPDELETSPKPKHR